MNTRLEQEGFARFAEGVERERARYLSPSYRAGLLSTSATERPVDGAVGSAEVGLPMMVRKIIQSRSSNLDTMTHEEM